MAASFSCAIVANALQQFSHGGDITAELNFLTSLSSDLLSVKCFSDKKDEVYLPAQFNGGDGSSDILTVEDVDIADDKKLLSWLPTEKNHQYSTQKNCSSKQQDENFEVDLGCGDLSQYNQCTPHPPLSSLMSSSSVLAAVDSQRKAFSKQENTSDQLATLADAPSRSQKTQHLSWTLNSLCDSRELAQQLVGYVFRRRYGLLDLQNEDSLPQGACPSHCEQETTGTLNKQLDAVIMRLSDLHVTTSLAAAYFSLLQCGMPNMRKRLVEHVMHWLSHSKSLLEKPTFKHVKALVLLGLGDVWSTIRKACSIGLSRLFRDWSLPQQMDFFGSLLEICINVDGSWQSKDGAVLCVYAILSHCYDARSDQREDLPDFVVECVLTVAFSLISHPQQSIRDTIVRTIAVYMDYINSKDQLELMQQALTLLTPSSCYGNNNQVFCSIDAYAAETLINICKSIFKVLPEPKAVEIWLGHSATFLTYLAHSTSSVRQSTSSLLLHIATHQRSGVVLMKLIMRQLMDTWLVSLQSLSLCDHFLPECQEAGPLTWEGKEGRMFAYELICRHLVEDHATKTASTVNGGLERVLQQDQRTSMEETYVTLARHLSQHSSLRQLYLLDTPKLLSDIADTKTLANIDTQLLQSWLLTHSPCLPQLCDINEGGFTTLDWPTGRDLLLTVLHQTAACLADTQWELRRIAQQVLPCMFEVMCLYDIDLIMTVWTYMAEKTSLQSFLGLSAFYYSLTLCAKAVAVADLDNKDCTIRDPVYRHFVDVTRRHIGPHIPLVVWYLHRSQYDKMAIMASEAAVLAVNFFELQRDIKEELCSSVMGLWHNLFFFAHPKNAMAGSLFPEPSHKFCSPYDGFLSCCLVRPESGVQCAKQVEKHFMMAIHRHLQHFVPQLSESLAYTCLPLLAHNIGLFVDDTDTCKSLISSFYMLCQRTRTWFTSQGGPGNGPSDDTRALPLKSLFFTLRELTAVIALQALDTGLLQKLLGCYLLLCPALQPNVHLPFLLQAVLARLSRDVQEKSVPLEMSEFDTDLDVQLGWRPPQLPPRFGQQLANSCQGRDETSLSSAEDNDSDADLNHSGSLLDQELYGRSGRRRTLSTTDDVLEIREVAENFNSSDRSLGKDEEEESGEEEEEESDWDSWSEEEVDQENAVLLRHFQEFFQKLWNLYGIESETVLKTETGKLGAKEQSLLQSVLIPWAQTQAT